ncbi:tyrosine-type recombinase/integrase [Nannocystis pusilla]|uniref:tyrosine-type recombinase/integrase n=1 Tax=Nannocystis pusilla TaxID=889268 RepID=UPI003B798D2B
MKAAPYRDTQGPGKEGFRRLLKAAEGNKRNLAILWLLYSMALRRGEVAGLDYKHVKGNRLFVKSKGDRSEAERKPLTIPKEAQKPLAEWLAARGDEPGPLFLNAHRGVQDHTRLSTRSIARMLAVLAKKAGLGHVRPHGLRHTAITVALKLCGGDLRRVQDFSRHKDPRTVIKYDDNRRDRGGQVAAKVAGDVEGDDEDDDVDG